MAETIYTIPINEAFEHRCGCPMCRLEREQEAKTLEYINGAAMMEPDVRQETNLSGFCREHYDALLSMKNRLGLALTLESHLEGMRGLISAQPGGGGKRLLGKKDAQPAGNQLVLAAESCFVCRRVEAVFAKYLSNTVQLWKTDPRFRELFSSQPCYCLRHGGQLLSEAGRSLSPAQFTIFRDELTGVMAAYAEGLQEALSGFIRSFDHRFAGQTLTEAQRGAVEDAADFLSGANKEK